MPVYTKQKVCSVCAKPLSGRQTKYCSQKCKTHELSSYPQQKQRRFIRKLELIKRAGGACANCGYSTNTAAFHFHHVDPTKKSFLLDSRAIVNRPLESVLEEFANCILLCANCHAELHNPDMQYEKLKKEFEGIEVN
jgi:hypothetical protein